MKSDEFPRLMLTDDQLVERDYRRDLGAELLEAIRLVKAGQVGAIRRIRIDGVHSDADAVEHPDEQCTSIAERGSETRAADDGSSSGIR